MANKLYTNGIGRIAADLYDFHSHIDGTSFNHAASGITTSPGVSGATNVQTSIDNINLFIASMANIGTAFVSIPDGYNSYTYPANDVYFDATVPPLNDFLTPLFNAIIAGGTSMPAGYERLRNGGILYLPAGTYYITSTVSIPPSIVLLGEGYATKIINGTAIDFTVNPIIFKSPPSHAPLFLIKYDSNRSLNDFKVDFENYFMFSRSVKFINLTIGDNFIDPTTLTDVNYVLPQNTTGDSPLIMQEQGSHLELENVKIIGRVLNTAGVVATDGATRFAVKLDTITPLSTGTILKINNCFIDGFSQPISFLSTGGTNDYLEINNSKIRSHGYLGNNSTLAIDNCLVIMNDNNAIITSNYLYGNHSLCNNAVVIYEALSVSSLQSRSKISICNNNFAINKSSNSSITSNILYPNITSIPNVLTSASILCYGNTFQDSKGFTIEDVYGIYFSTTKLATTIGSVVSDHEFKVENVAGTLMDLTSNTATINAGVSMILTSPNITSSLINTSIVATNEVSLDSAIITKRTHTISAATASYTIDSGATKDYIIFVDTGTTAKTITLPSAPGNGRTIIIKDITGTSSTYAITVAPATGGTIEGGAVDAIVVLNANWGKYEFICSGSGDTWFII